MAISARRLTRLGLLAALGIILNLIERQFPPPVPVPGVRLGLANMATLMALLIDGPGGGFLVWAVRFVLASLLGGSLFGPGFWVGGAGGLAAWAAMAAALRIRRDPGLGTISVAGAAAHHIGQVGAAALVTSTPGVLSLVWPLLALAAPTGLLTGFAGSLLGRRLGLTGQTPETASWRLRKADFAVAALLLAVALVPVWARQNGGQGLAAEVIINGQVTTTFDLRRDEGLHPIPHMQVEVHEGAVRVLESDCPDQVCVISGWARYPGDLLVCAPNRTVIRIVGGGPDPQGPDAILR